MFSTRICSHASRPLRSRWVCKNESKRSCSRTVPISISNRRTRARAKTLEARRTRTRTRTVSLIRRTLFVYNPTMELPISTSDIVFPTNTGGTGGQGGYQIISSSTNGVGFYGKQSSANEKLSLKTDQDTLREGYRFIRTEEDDMNRSWEQRLVKRYYDKLFKEYCIADMSHYKTGKIGLRWRTEKEVISGKGYPDSNFVHGVDCFRSSVLRYANCLLQHKKTILEKAKSLVESINGSLVMQSALLDEVVNLVEAHVPVFGKFNESFLELPKDLPYVYFDERIG